MENYWGNILNKRLTRRRAIAATGAATGAAAFLAACGGSDSNGGGGTGGGGGSGAAIDTKGITDGYLARADADAKKGGTIGFIYTDSPHLNILTNALEYAGYSGQYVYDHLISSRSNDNAPFVLEAAEGAGAAGPDITIRFKLRPGMTYHNIAPVNGRAVKAEDVVKVQKYVKTPDRRRERLPEGHPRQGRQRRTTAPSSTSSRRRPPTCSRRVMLGHPGPQAIIPPETFDNLATARQVGSGPFQLDRGRSARSTTTRASTSTTAAASRPCPTATSPTSSSCRTTRRVRRPSAASRSTTGQRLRRLVRPDRQGRGQPR